VIPKRGVFVEFVCDFMHGGRQYARGDVGVLLGIVDDGYVVHVVNMGGVALAKRAQFKVLNVNRRKDAAVLAASHLLHPDWWSSQKTKLYSALYGGS
jgi:hypothetical protein